MRSSNTQVPTQIITFSSDIMQTLVRRRRSRTATCRSRQILFTRSFAQSLTRSRVDARLYAELLNFELK